MGEWICEVCTRRHAILKCADGLWRCNICWNIYVVEWRRAKEKPNG